MSCDDENRLTNKQQLINIEEQLKQIVANQNNIQNIVVNIYSVMENLLTRYDLLNERISVFEDKICQINKSTEEVCEKNQHSLLDITILFREILNDYYSNINEIINLFVANNLIDTIPQSEETACDMDVIIEENRNIIKLITSPPINVSENVSAVEFQEFMDKLREKKDAN